MKETSDTFHNLHIDDFFQLCNLHPDSQQHALTFSFMLQHLKPWDIETLQQVNYKDIFDSIQDQFKITKLYQTIINTKKMILRTSDSNAAYPDSNTGPHGYCPSHAWKYNIYNGKFFFLPFFKHRPKGFKKQIYYETISDFMRKFLLI